MKYIDHGATKLRSMFFAALVMLGVVVALHAQTGPSTQAGEEVTVRGMLSRDGKAGNLWTLTLDKPFDVHDPREPNPDKKAMLQILRFTTRAGSSQYGEFEGKHVELTGSLVTAFGPGTAGVAVKTIRILQDDGINPNDVLDQIQRSLKKLPSGAITKYPASVLPFNNWEPLPIALDKIATPDGIQISACSAQHRSVGAQRDFSQAECDYHKDKELSASEAAKVLTEWIVVPKELWFNNFSHTDVAYRALQLRQTEGKDFVLEVQTYGVGMVVFADESGAYVVSACNAAMIKPGGKPGGC